MYILFIFEAFYWKLLPHHLNDLGKQNSTCSYDMRHLSYYHVPHVFLLNAWNKIPITPLH